MSTVGTIKILEVPSLAHSLMHHQLKLIYFGLFLAFTTACENSGKFSEQTCTSWKDKGFCKDSPYEQFMADNCAKTCGCLEENTVYTDDCTNEGTYLQNL